MALKTYLTRLDAITPGTPEYEKILLEILDSLENKSVNSQKNNFTIVRKYITTHVQNEELRERYKNMFTLSSEEYDVVRHDYETKVKSQLSDIRNYPRESFLMEIHEMYECSQVYCMISALLFYSGRRLTEVVSEGGFERSRIPNHILFSGQLKTRKEDEEKEFDIPILVVTPESFLEHLKYMRMKAHGIKLSTVTMGVNILLKKTFDDKFSSKDLRKLYAEEAYQQYADKTTVAKPVYLGNILGHSELDLSTNVTYQSVILSD